MTEQKFWDQETISMKVEQPAWESGIYQVTASYTFLAATQWIKWARPFNYTRLRWTNVFPQGHVSFNPMRQCGRLPVLHNLYEHFQGEFNSRKWHSLKFVHLYLIVKQNLCQYISGQISSLVNCMPSAFAHGLNCRKQIATWLQFFTL